MTAIIDMSKNDEDDPFFLIKGKSDLMKLRKCQRIVPSMPSSLTPQPASLRRLLNHFHRRTNEKFDESK